MSAKRARLARRANFLSEFHGNQDVQYTFEFGLKVIFRGLADALKASTDFASLATKLECLRSSAGPSARWGGTGMLFDVRH